MIAMLQWLSRSFRVHQIRFRPGPFSARTPLWELTTLPIHPSWFKGDPTSKGNEREGEGEGTPPNANSCISS